MPKGVASNSHVALGFFEHSRARTQHLSKRRCNTTSFDRSCSEVPPPTNAPTGNTLFRLTAEHQRPHFSAKQEKDPGRIAGPCPYLLGRVAPSLRHSNSPSGRLPIALEVTDQCCTAQVTTDVVLTISVDCDSTTFTRSSPVELL